MYRRVERQCRKKKKLPTDPIDTAPSWAVVSIGDSAGAYGITNNRGERERNTSRKPKRQKRRPVARTEKEGGFTPRRRRNPTASQPFSLPGSHHTHFPCVSSPSVHWSSWGRRFPRVGERAGQVRRSVSGVFESVWVAGGRRRRGARGTGVGHVHA